MSLAAEAAVAAANLQLAMSTRAMERANASLLTALNSSAAVAARGQMQAAQQRVKVRVRRRVWFVCLSPIPLLE
jgi:hypothetical protein